MDDAYPPGEGDIAAIADRPQSSLAVYGLSQEGSSSYWPGLEADGRLATRAAIVDGPPGYSKPQDEPELAADSSGQFVLAWCTFADAESQQFVATPCNRVAVAVGHSDHLVPAQLITPSSEVEDEVQDSMDSAGEAAIMWSGRSETPGPPGVSEARGISVAIYRP